MLLALKGRRRGSEQRVSDAGPILPQQFSSSSEGEHDQEPPKVLEAGEATALYQFRAKQLTNMAKGKIFSPMSKDLARRPKRWNQGSSGADVTV
jgi:hypothetical protein